MNYIHSEVTIAGSAAVVVTLDHAANVKVMDDLNYNRYRRGLSHRYLGGHATESPVVIRPSEGRWHVAVDLGGYPGTVRASIRVQ